MKHICAANKDGTNVGLAACRGAVNQQSPYGLLCKWHRQKLDVFGGSWFVQAYLGVYPGPDPTYIPSYRGNECSECGHTFFVR